MLLSIGIIAGVVLGYVLMGIPGAVVGPLLAWVIYQSAHLEKRVERLEREIQALKNTAARTETVPQPPPVAATAAMTTARPARVGAPSASDWKPAASLPSPPPYIPPVLESATPFEQAMQRLNDTNIVLKVGVVVLFFGVAFLLKYASDQGLFPIGMRLAAVAAGALFLIALGWRLRTRNTNYAVVIQGAGLGLLYITVYATVKVFLLISWWPAFAAIVLLVLCGTWLALMQNNLSLTLLALAGGFLSPLLLADEPIDHFLLFSFYTILNAGIVTMAWFKSWREINLFGFSATAGVAVYWGFFYYSPVHYLLAQIFLIGFFLTYVLVAVLYAFKHGTQFNLRNAEFVDTLLVFSLPAVCFSLQTGLSGAQTATMAGNAAAFGAFYTALYFILRPWTSVAALGKAFLALGIVFLTLALPFAMDGNWTAMAWAWESLALLWFGVRYERVLARLSAALLQLAAAAVFILNGGGWTWMFTHYAAPAAALNSGAMPPLLNTGFVGGVLLAIAGFAGCYLFNRVVKPTESDRFLLRATLIWGLFWWLFSFVAEIVNRVSAEYWSGGLLLFFGGTAGITALLAKRYGLPAFSFVTAGLLPAALLCLLLGWYLQGHFITVFSVWSWVLFFSVHFLGLKWFHARWSLAMIKTWHGIGFNVFIFVVAFECVWNVTTRTGAGPVTVYAATALVPLLIFSIIQLWGKRMPWPVSFWLSDLYLPTTMPVAFFLFFWMIYGVTFSRPEQNQSYFPLFNPLDTTQIAIWVSLLLFVRNVQIVAARSEQETLTLYHSLAVAGVALISVLLARSVHAFTGVPYQWEPLFASVVFQAAITLTWTGVALLSMVISTRRHARSFWFFGAALLAMVVFKLFFVDLTGVGTVARIVSFIAVGVLMLVIGYFSPLPPKRLAPA